MARSRWREEKGGEEAKFIVSVFAVANKRKRLHFAEAVYSFCQQERDENRRQIAREPE